MNIHKILISLVLAAVLILTSAAAFAAPPEGVHPPHGMFHLMGLTGISGDQKNLYVMAGGKIMQYGLADLKLLKTVDLPKPAPPANMPPKDKEAMPWPPPFPPKGGPHGLWAGEGSLYVLAGPMLHRYSTPDLTLKSTMELPKPEPPRAAN